MAPSQVPDDANYSIAAVSKLTGISCHALRVWERRYGFPVPHRSPSGHRRYSREQAQLLRRVAAMAHSGHSIGDLIADIRSGWLSVEEVPDQVPAPDRDPPSAELTNLLLAGRLSEACARFDQLARELSPTELITRIFEPALIDVGERWFRGECNVFQEHCASGFLRRKVEVQIDSACRANTRPVHTIAIGTVQGDRHEGGILLLHLTLELAGWRVLNLGVDLPVREFQKAVSEWRPDALGLSFILSRNINKRFRELTQIRGLPIFVGGRSILNYQGLARRHELIPLTGPVTISGSELLAEFDAWVKAHP